MTADDLAVFCLHDLVEVDLFLKACQTFQVGSRGYGLECGTEMNFAYPDTGAGKAIEGVFGFLVLHSEVAGVVVYAENVSPFFVRAETCLELFEKGHGFLACLKESEWFRFQAEVQVKILCLGCFLDMSSACREVIEHDGGNFARGDEFLEGPRQGAHASFGALLRKLGQQVEE